MSFVHELRVRYGECDPQGIVFNANYLLYFDVAFTEYWRDRGRPLGRDGELGVDAVVAEANLALPRAGALRRRARARGHDRGAGHDVDDDARRRPPRRGAAGRVPAAPRLRRPQTWAKTDMPERSGRGWRRRRRDGAPGSGVPVAVAPSVRGRIQRQRLTAAARRSRG